MKSPSIWEECLQILCDILISPDGIPGTLRNKDQPQYTKLYTTNSDIQYADEYKIPRISQGGFNQCLQYMFTQLYQRDLDITKYGKPHLLTFQYAGNIYNCREYHSRLCSIASHEPLKYLYDRR